MKHKLIQDFSNVCCQMFLTSLSNSDRINFVLFGSGAVSLNFIDQKCTHNNIGISPLFYCISFREWLEQQCSKNDIDFVNIIVAELKVNISVDTYRNTEGGIPGWLSSTMGFECSSRIGTSDREYTSSMNESQNMGLGQLIYGNQY